MLKTIAAAFACFVMLVARGQQEPSPPATTLASIPEELKKDADAVYKLDEAVLTVLSPSEYTLKVHKVMTLLNADAAYLLHHRFTVDKLFKVEDIEIKVLDAFGQLVKKYTKKDFETVAAYDGMTLVTDDKVMKLYTPAPAYPCTLDVQYTRHATGYNQFLNRYIYQYRTVTELFRYEVFAPVSLDIRQRTLNLSATPQVEAMGNTKRYVWEVKNVSAKKFETDGYTASYYMPRIEIAPNEFSYDGYKGEFRSWADYGRWAYKLFEEKTPFSQDRIADIKELVKGAKDRQEIISTLYQYLQHNTRYVNIQLGIGGWKPFAIKFVDENKFGDCKALTNYMRYLLQAVGIMAYPALINSGYEEPAIDPQFPNNVFSHVILCVPNDKDTTWLECTSTYNKAGELGTFTENKKALLLTENGGVIVNTPKSDYRANTVCAKSTVTINAGGGATIQNEVASSGEPASYYHDVFQLKEDEQKQRLMQTLHFKNPDEISVSSFDDKGQAGFGVVRTYERFYDFKSGNKYFLPLCVNRSATERMKVATRETDYLFAYPYEKSDTTVFHFPQGFTPEALPAGKELQSPYSYYKRTCRYDAASNQLTTVSTVSLKQHVIPAADYPKVAQFFNDVIAIEEENIIVVKQ
ncbi:DUF3857 domain-containing protein [Flavisolibacter ginsenosidimutans]|uniref:DUF3857 domain-containing protein n=1 Tax=Flavisolibacter ginsenosidimutans TaxID=661481 RepID=A0A5B8ULF6_9BACT|nr:DUF3857 domain-containing protein [Flavisolibacter ginsenosidimutans]QEC56845.1 DUF3857 domain-containing protein [Flavisolibacter ginsenosidimutans]